MLPLSSLVWQASHLEITNWLVTGMPATGVDFAASPDFAASEDGVACGFWANASIGTTRIDASRVFITLFGYHTPLSRERGYKSCL